VFQNWELVPVEDGPVEIDPARLLVVFDVRTTPQPIDDFLKSCVGGINSPPKITKMKSSIGCGVVRTTNTTRRRAGSISTGPSSTGTSSQFWNTAA
jgi:hypothetical protein